MVIIISKKTTENYNHIPFKNIPISKKTQIKKLPYFPPINKQDRISHGNELEQKISLILQDQLSLKNQKIYPPELNPSLIFKIEQEKDVVKKSFFPITDKNLDESNIEIIEQENDQFLIVFSRDQDLKMFKSKLDEYKTGDSNSYEKNPFFGNIKSLDKINKYEKMGKKFKEYYQLNHFPEIKNKIRIDYWWTTKEKINSIIEVCEKKIIQNGGEIIEKYVEYGIASLIAVIPNIIFESILELTEILKIEIIEKTIIKKDYLKITKIELPKVELKDIKNKNKVCLIDTGVTSKHPVIDGTIYDEILNTTESSIKSDEDGHGTYLSGNILYRDMEFALSSAISNGSALIPEVQIISVKIAKETCSTTVSDLNFRIIKSIETVYLKHNCKIFILTYLPFIINENGPDPNPSAKSHQLSILLDRLISEKDILIIAPIGNILLEEFYNDAPMLNNNSLLNGQYLNYNLNKRVFEGASANSVLTVGALSGKDEFTSLDSAAFNPSQLTIFSGKSDPAPFSRTGFGLGGAIKPDLCTNGGNVVFIPSRNPTIRGINSTKYIGPNYQFFTDLFVLDYGTCLSACSVANVCCKLMHLYPNHSMNFYRAMLGNRLSPGQFTDETKRNTNVVTDSKNVHRIYGFGVLDENHLYFGNRHTISLFFEGEVPLNDFHIFQIPIPESFKTTNGNRGITISLAYSPYVQYRKQYRAVQLEFTYIYDTCSIKDLLAKFDKASSSENDDNLSQIVSESKNDYDVDISSTIRKKSTLQVARFTWDEFSSRQRKKTIKMINSNHFVVVSCKKQSWFNNDLLNIDKQKYAIVVTIWHEKVNEIYESVKNIIQVREHVKNLV